MQVVMNKCFLLNPEKKIGADLHLVVFEKNTKNAHLKGRVHGYTTLWCDHFVVAHFVVALFGVAHFDAGPFWSGPFWREFHRN